MKISFKNYIYPRYLRVIELMTLGKKGGGWRNEKGGNRLIFIAYSTHRKFTMGREFNAENRQTLESACFEI